MKKIIFVVVMLFSFSALAQTIPLDQKQWYSKSKVGSAPPTWNSEEYSNNTGFLDDTGKMCLAHSTNTCDLYINQYTIDGNVINTNGGAMDAGTQTVTLATDDPSVTSLGILDNWNATEDSPASTDGAQMMCEAKSSQKSAVDDGDAVRPVTNLHGEIVTSGYSWSTNSNRSAEINPLDTRSVPATTVDVTNGTDGTYSYYYDMQFYRHFAVQMTLSGGSGTVTVKFYCTNTNDGTAPGSCTYQDVTNDLFAAASFTATDYLVDDAGKSAGCKYVKIEVVAATGGANDADWKLEVNQWW